MNGENQQPAAPQGQPTPAAPTPAAAPNQPGQASGFWNRNWKMIARLLIVAVIIAGAVLYARYNDNEEPENQTPDNQSTQNQPGNQNPIVVTPGNGTTPTPSGDSTIRVTDNRYTVVVQRGEGYTKIARRTLAEYLKNKSASLSPEQKIYAEDYLQKHTAGKSRLYTGNEVNFTAEEMNNAVQAAQNLTAKQIQNLHKYVTRVPNL